MHGAELTLFFRHKLFLMQFSYPFETEKPFCNIGRWRMWFFGWLNDIAIWMLLNQ